MYVTKHETYAGRRSNHCDGTEVTTHTTFRWPNLAQVDSLGISGEVIFPLHSMHDTPLSSEFHNIFQTMLRHVYREHVEAQICKFNFHKNKYKYIVTTYLQYLYKVI